MMFLIEEVFDAKIIRANFAVFFFLFESELHVFTLQFTCFLLKKDKS